MTLEEDFIHCVIDRKALQWATKGNSDGDE